MIKNLSKYLFISLMTVGTAWMLQSCGEESSSTPADNSPVSVLFSLAAPAVSRAAEYDALRDTELINDWWIVFIKDNTAVKILDRTATGAVDQEYFSVTLDPGIYDVIAYANISRDELQEKTSLTYAGGEAASLSETASKTWAMANNGLMPGTDLVPMSGFLKGINVTDDDNNVTYSIEVVRMLAKVEAQITNKSKKSLTLNGITFGVLNKGDIALMPDYDKLAARPDILDAAGNTVESLSFGDIDEQIAVESTYSNVFYVRESDAAITHPAGRFYVTLRFTREDGAETEQHYAVTDELQWIQRNDHIVIPITVTDLQLDWNVTFYPPIGGYPAVVKRTEGDDNFFTFGTQGKFLIRPIVRLEDGSVLPPSQYDFEINGTEGDISIFTKMPEKDTLTGEITGELNSNTGSAILTCTITADIDEETQTRVRKIYIIRE